MKINWFTVIAQVINFLVLVWLLKKFLYKPILNAIDEREKKIAAQIKDADDKKAAAIKEQDDFKKKNEDFDQQKKGLMDKVVAESNTEKDKLLEAAKNDANTLRSNLEKSAKENQENQNAAIAQKTQKHVLDITRKALTDIASISLEEQSANTFIKRLNESKDDEKKQFIDAFKSNANAILVRSAFDLPEKQQREINNAVDTILGTKTQLQFKTTPELISGIELTTNGYKLAWSFSEYLNSLEKNIAEKMKVQPEVATEINNMPSTDLHTTIDDNFKLLDKSIKEYSFPFAPNEVGYVTSIATGIAKVSGLPGAGFEELLKFPNGIFGIAYNIDEHEIGVILLGKDSLLNAGDEVERTGRVMDIPVGDALLGRVINPLGEPIDDNGPIAHKQRMPIERPAPAIMDRAAVNVPLQTGIKVIDALIPIGRGQRELILGDRQTGKTAIAIDAIINQKDKNVVCIYCAIGQRASAVAKAVANLKEKDAMAYTVVVVAEGNNSPGLEYIAPYASTTIAEYFMEQGRDVLIVYDDLTHHARSYRELSLLLRRPPGREAFPGDIFYIHSRLLERSTHLSDALKGGSLTALPIIETEAQNISAYIPTNLISITDGQIYLSPKLFELGILPAVDVGKSVSRVGDAAQLPAYRSIARLKLDYSQFEELESFARFGTRLDDNTKKIIEHGKRIRECLKQPELQHMPVTEQIVVLLALTNGLFDKIAIGKIKDAETALVQNINEIPQDILKRLSSDKELSDDDNKAILKISTTILAPFQDKPVPEENKK